MTSRRDALAYHADGRPGKIKVVPTKATLTANDLSLAYSPGVAEPSREISKNPEEAYRYTAKGNLVAVISNGTAVLGLGNSGAIAGKPVMEGRGVLCKRFADVFDIEVDSEDPEEVIQTCQLIAPTFGGINLGDIRSPECFEIERRLKESLDIPVFRDDHHGTAIISAAAPLNALEITGKKIEEIRVVSVGSRRGGHFLRAPLPRFRGAPGKLLDGGQTRGRPRRPTGRHERVQAGVRGRRPTAGPWPTPCEAPTSSWVSPRQVS